jgi:thiamine biosynthesis lipoprotein
MGSRCTIVLESTSEAEAARAARLAFDEIARIEQVLSDYRDDSESMRLTRLEPNGWHPVSDTLMEVLLRSRDIHNRTNGAFDPSVGAFTHLWRRPEPPTSQAIKQASDQVGFHHFQLDEAGHSVRFDRTGIILDFGGIGKGYAAQKAIEILREQGHPIASVDMGGDLAFGDPPSEQPQGWRVEIITGLSETRVEHLANCAIATSGDLERYYEYEGIRYSHIVDPRTGMGITERRAATVIAHDAATADALASALSVLGQSGLEKLSAQYPDAQFDLVVRSMSDN